jgi:metal-responsive CopG/Arc/MetJ family transcriptional regulator
MSASHDPRDPTNGPERSEAPSKAGAAALHRVQAYLDGNMANAFHKRCAELGVGRSEYARRLIRKDLNESPHERALEERIEARVAATLNAHADRHREQLDEALAQILNRLAGE